MATPDVSDRTSMDPKDWRYPDLWDKSRMWERGHALRSKIGDMAMLDDLQELAQFDPLLPHYLVEFFYGEILSRPHLDPKTRTLCALAALLCKGDEEGTEGAIDAALNAGVTCQEVVEVVVQTGAFAGFRHWVIGARAGLRVFRRRGLPPAPDSESAWRDPNYWNKENWWARGWARRDEMWGGQHGSTSGEWAVLDPLFPHYVNEFRFGEILSRPGLDRKTQHLCAFAAFLAVNSEGGAEGAAYGALEAGATHGELADAVFQTGCICGYAKWTYGGRAALKALRLRGMVPAARKPRAAKLPRAPKRRARSAARSRTSTRRAAARGSTALRARARGGRRRAEGSRSPRR
jgi:4-carboxymuconolactone decarboxylase